jgi:hypothetical protein
MMAKSEAEILDDQADKVGVMLSEAQDALRLLFDEINFGPEIESGSEADSALTQLQHVTRLVDVAVDLYPYPFGEDR